ncbi:DNA ligase D [Rossellomorea aquimaris]|uniref:Bifunctional non-homologous end joining protein LigD n=1 Tax=Rossellomorea aquimaris TaxID=189382 RepID=A0A366EBA9_9BACI|nr:DNA ligase D [Rossellomorea aquimaris]RBO99661.1 bifunctional non-homologous end joining protein LigD [Rossellomorea aquimaris]
MKPMLPTLYDELPENEEWLYEVKYDGFRGILYVDSENQISLQSRNGKELLPHFPEIEKEIKTLLNERDLPTPFILDGEIALLRSSCSSEFFELQIRGRMRNKQKIDHAAAGRPVKFLAFDLLQYGKKSFASEPYLTRKEKLKEFFTFLQLPLEPTPSLPPSLQMVPYFNNRQEIWELVEKEEGEGVIAKRKNSRWEAGKRSTSWVKTKNWKHCHCFITALDETNDYYHIGVFDNEKIMPIGLFHFGLSPEEKKSLKAMIKKNSTKNVNSLYYIDPAITVEISYLNWYEDQLREPHFHRFLFSITPESCTMEQFKLDEASLPRGVEITHPDKELFQKVSMTKLDYVRYLRKMSVAILPFLKDRPLTCIRFPHGLFGESFYQKNTPDYAPSFIETYKEDNIDYTVCNNLETLIWLGNQLALEFHIPFQRTKDASVNEVVFDLDPPSRDQFSLAVKAASIMKELFDRLNLHSFVKTSGNKGLQVYIPIPPGYTWKDTGLFTEFIAHYLVTNYPEDFTIERLKKNRKGRLYVDYIQHGEGKTIIAPYSLRGNEDALIATPLWWYEVNEDLHPEHFTIDVVLQRFRQMGCPFTTFDWVKDLQPFCDVIQFLKQQSNHKKKNVPKA